jgi:hypothetical protein
MNAPATEEFLTLQEIVAAAKRNLPPGPWAYLIGGAETETTVRRNRHALDCIAFRPRVLRDVSKIDSTWTFLGEKVRLPLMLAPQPRRAPRRSSACRRCSPPSASRDWKKRRRRRRPSAPSSSTCAATTPGSTTS